MAVSVKKNIVANYLGSAWGGLMGLAFIPLYIYFLGIESYGLIGIFGTLQASLALLDMGLTPTLNREMAKFGAGEHTPQSIQNLLRTVEWIYLAIALLIGGGMSLVAPWLATDWLKVEGLDTATVADALAITGWVIAARWLSGLYRSGIAGLQRQVWLSGCTAFFATLRGVGVLGVLVWVSPTIGAFFEYQGVLFALETLVLALKLRSMLPTPPAPASFSWRSLGQVWEFAAGMMIITMLGVLLTQVDKVVLSRLLPLAEFGYYALASTVAGALYLVIRPLYTAACPRLTELVAKGDGVALAGAYHKLSQLLTLLIVPGALVLSFFAEHILLLWTRNEATTAATAPLVSLLVLGTMLNGLMHMPAALQLAYGWVRLAIIADVLFVLLSPPLVYFGVREIGAVAAAWVWLALNVGYVFAVVPIMHRRLLRGEMLSWYGRDVLLPAGAAFAAVTAVSMMAPAPSIGNPLGSIVVVTAAVVAALAASVSSTPIGRDVFVRHVWQLWGAR